MTRSRPAPRSPGFDAGGALRLWVVLGAIGLASSPCPAAAAGDLNLFQMVARADLVARVRVINGSLRFASVEVLETIKGQSPAPQLRIAFRDFNWSRPRGEAAIVFPDGQEEILILVPYTEVKRTEKNRDIYELFHGPAGRFVLALEGPDEAGDAIRRLAEVARYDPAAQVEALRRDMTSRNRVLAVASLSEVRRLRAADPTLFPVLATLLGSPVTGIRAAALDLVGQVFRASSVVDPGSAASEVAASVLARSIEIARNDPEPAVRVEAVKVLAAWPHRSETTTDLEQLASGDPDQLVRYEARKALLAPR